MMPANATLSRPIRVLLIVESSGGGTGRHVMDLAAGLLQRSCEVHLAYSDARADQAFKSRLAQMPGVTRFLLPMRSSIHPDDLRTIWELRRYVRAQGPFDVIHGHSSKGGAFARLAALGSGARVFYTMHGLVVIDRGIPRLKRAIYWFAEFLLGPLTSRIVAVGPEEARAAIGYGLGRQRVSVVPNGVDIEPLPGCHLVRREWGLGPEHVVVGFVGRLVEQKALDVLISAFAIATRSLPSARLVIIGSGPLETKLKAHAAKLGVDSRLLWLGECAARRHLSGMDVFAIASRKEGLPYVVLEAMAAGLPIVATSSAGVESLVHDGENGHVVPPGDEHALAAALARLLVEPDHRRKLAGGSLLRVARFSVAEMVDKTFALYRTELSSVPGARRTAGARLFEFEHS